MLRAFLLTCFLSSLNHFECHQRIAGIRLGKSMKHQAYCLASLAGILSVPLAAQPVGSAPVATASHKLSISEEMVVTAHRTPVPAYRIGSSVSVLNATDIEAKGQVNVADLLRSVPGVAVSRNGGLGKATSLRIRGEEGYRTVVYVDGVKISDPTGTQISPRLAHLMSGDIESIEVLRGPQGMMYGADAGGVVNITTKQPTEALEGGLNLEAGRYDTQRISGALRGKLDRLTYALSGSDFSTDGFNAMDNDTVLADDDGYDNRTYNARLGFQATDELRFDAIYRDVDAVNEYDSSFGTRDRVMDFEQITKQLKATYEQASWSQQLSLSQNDVQRQLYEDGALSPYGGKYKGQIKQFEYMGALDVSALNSLSYGVDVQQQEDEVNNLDQDQKGVYLEWRGNFFNHWFYSAGVRHDHNDDFGDFVTYRLTTAYTQFLTDGASLKYRGSFGTGFRAPSLYELSYNMGTGLAPLEQEESEGFDLGVEYRTANGHLVEVVYFNQEIDNAIDFDLVNYIGYLQEAGVSRSKGVELNTEWVLNNDWFVIANATYNDTSDSNGEQRARRPRNIFNIGVQGTLLGERLRLNADLRGSYGSVDNDGSALKDYETLNVSAGYQVTPNLEVYARGENVFSTDYQEIGHYNTSKAAVYGGVRVKF